jgi:hypothetical protein
LAFVELRVLLELSRQAIDDVERRSEDSDWQPVKDAAEKFRPRNSGPALMTTMKGLEHPDWQNR